MAEEYFAFLQPRRITSLRDAPRLRRKRQQKVEKDAKRAAAANCSAVSAATQRAREQQESVRLESIAKLRRSREKKIRGEAEGSQKQTLDLLKVS